MFEERCVWVTLPYIENENDPTGFFLAFFLVLRDHGLYVVYI